MKKYHVYRHPTFDRIRLIDPQERIVLLWNGSEWLRSSYTAGEASAYFHYVGTYQMHLK